jgi:surfeit locus 1 family protein
MAARVRLFVFFAFVAAAVFVRLGFWQIRRLQFRRAQNALVKGRLDSTVVGVGEIPADPTAARFRRARVIGIPDYAHEMVVIVRINNGSPGVNLITPIRRAGRDTAILVNRGWVYSPDGMTVDLGRWQEPDTVFAGYLETFTTGSSAAALREQPSKVRRMDYAAIARGLPYPIAPVYLVELADSGGSAQSSRVGDRIARLGAPPLDEGPHLGYAIQWFAFAVTALVGAGLVAFKH